MDLNDIKTTDFDYDLPEELIAQTPLKDRKTSRMMVLHIPTGEYEHKHCQKQHKCDSSPSIWHKRRNRCTC